MSAILPLSALVSSMRVVGCRGRWFAGLGGLGRRRRRLQKKVVVGCWSSLLPPIAGAVRPHVLGL